MLKNIYKVVESEFEAQCISACTSISLPSLKKKKKVKEVVSWVVHLGDDCIC